MLKETIETRLGVRVILADSITKATDQDGGAVMVSASHGGQSSAEFALDHPLGLVMFNDAGGGKDDAGIAVLRLLEHHGRPAAVISHETARIGEALDHWSHGIVSAANPTAQTRGVQAGMSVQDAVHTWIDTPHGPEQDQNQNQGQDQDDDR